MLCLKLSISETWWKFAGAIIPGYPNLNPGPMIFGKPFGNCTQASVTRTPNERYRPANVCNPRRKEGALGPIAREREPLQPAEAAWGCEEKEPPTRRTRYGMRKVTLRSAPSLRPGLQSLDEGRSRRRRGLQ
jgi:hypothetical protein